jgi:hypothetical protein
MSKIAISELFHELETTEQKAYRGGTKKEPSGKSYGSTGGKVVLQKYKPNPRWMGSGWNPNTSHADADALGL